MVRACFGRRFYREKGSALYSLVDPSRSPPTHAMRCQQSIFVENQEPHDMTGLETLGTSTPSGSFLG